MLKGHAMGEGKGCGSQVMLRVTGWWSREMLRSQGIPGDR